MIYEVYVIRYIYDRYMIYLLTAIGLTAGGHLPIKQYTEHHYETEYTE